MLTTCPECTYDLRGLPLNHACPECGFAYDEHTAVWRARCPAYAYAMPLILLAMLIYTGHAYWSNLVWWQVGIFIIGGLLLLSSFVRICLANRRGRYLAVTPV